MFRICRSRAFDYFLGIHFFSPVILGYPFFSLFLIIRHLFVLLVIRFFLYFSLYLLSPVCCPREEYHKYIVTQEK